MKTHILNSLRKKSVVATIFILLFIQSGVAFPIESALAQSGGCGSGGCGGGSSAAAGGGLGSLLSGGGGGMMKIMLALLPMLMQLFQGGGSTPQQGNVDEKLPQYGTVGPQGTGSQNGTNGQNNNGYSNDPYAYGGNGTTWNPYATPTPSSAPTLCSQTLFLAGDASTMVIKPTTVSIATGSCVNLINGTGSNRVMHVYKNDVKTTTNEQTVNKEGTIIFRFPNAGSYNFCVQNASTSTTAEICGTTVTVAN